MKRLSKLRRVELTDLESGVIENLSLGEAIRKLAELGWSEYWIFDYFTKEGLILFRHKSYRLLPGRGR